MFRSNPTITAGRHRIGLITPLSQMVFLFHVFGFMTTPKLRSLFPATILIEAPVCFALSRGFWLSTSSRSSRDWDLCDLGPSKGVLSDAPSLRPELGSADSSYMDSVLVDCERGSLSSCVASFPRAGGGNSSGGECRSMLAKMDGPTSSVESVSPSDEDGSKTSSILSVWLYWRPLFTTWSYLSCGEEDGRWARKEAFRLSCLSARTYEASSAVSSRTLRAYPALSIGAEQTC